MRLAAPLQSIPSSVTYSGRKST